MPGAAGAPGAGGSPWAGVNPPTWAWPDEPTAMPQPMEAAKSDPRSRSEPPRKVEYTSAVPVGLSLVMNTVLSVRPPGGAGWMGALDGKPAEFVYPVTYT